VAVTSEEKMSMMGGNLLSYVSSADAYDKQYSRRKWILRVDRSQEPAKGTGSAFPFFICQLKYVTSCQICSFTPWSVALSSVSYDDFLFTVMIFVALPSNL
jgi:hypothetical protein